MAQLVPPARAVSGLFSAAKLVLRNLRFYEFGGTHTDLAGILKYITSHKHLKIHQYMKRNERAKQTSPELQPVISEGCWISFMSFKREKKMAFANAAAAVQVWYFKFSVLAHF